jgi:hypothetical protein
VSKAARDDWKYGLTCDRKDRYKGFLLSSAKMVLKKKELKDLSMTLPARFEASNIVLAVNG